MNTGCLPAGVANPAMAADWAALMLVPAIILGIHWMRSPVTAVRGNLLSAAAMAGLVVWLACARGWWAMPEVWIWTALGAGLGTGLAVRARMIRMPELIACFNGMGGAASALVAAVALAPTELVPGPRVRSAALAAVWIGSVTLTGSVVAVLKLSRLLPAPPVRWRGQSLGRVLLLTGSFAALAAGAVYGPALRPAAVICGLLGLGLGAAALLRVGGADMPVSISLLNALTGIAAAVAGYAAAQPVPVAVGAMVGAGGLMLTRLMCRAMNRNLGDVLGGRVGTRPEEGETLAQAPAQKAREAADPVALLRRAKRVVIVPGYGMAQAQAQQAVRRLFDALKQRGAEVCFAVHPVAGRMPGHMHVLLAEVNLPYETFREMDAVNPEFPEFDVALVVGANDVVNPSAATTQGTPISGMPVLHADQARAVVVCNLDDQPGYAGVPNPLFNLPHTVLCPGNAADTVMRLAEAMEND